MSNEVPDDFIYPVRLYASSYMDVTDYVIQGKANRRRPEPHDHESRPPDDSSRPDEPVTRIRVTCKDSEQHSKVLRDLRSRLHDPPEMMYWLLAPRDEFFLLARDMPQVFVPDPQGSSVREGDDNDIYIAVVPWEKGTAG